MFKIPWMGSCPGCKYKGYSHLQKYQAWCQPLRRDYWRDKTNTSQRYAILQQYAITNNFSSYRRHHVSYRLIQMNNTDKTGVLGESGEGSESTFSWESRKRYDESAEGCMKFQLSESPSSGESKNFLTAAGWFLKGRRWRQNWKGGHPQTKEEPLLRHREPPRAFEQESDR